MDTVALLHLFVFYKINTNINTQDNKFKILVLLDINKVCISFCTVSYDLIIHIGKFGISIKFIEMDNKSLKNQKSISAILFYVGTIYLELYFHW